jgi:hypothetical protein
MGRRCRNLVQQHPVKDEDEKNAVPAVVPAAHRLRRADPCAAPATSASSSSAPAATSPWSIPRSGSPMPASAASATCRTRRWCYSRDGRYAYVFGRDGGLTKIDLLEARSSSACCSRATPSAVRSRRTAASSSRRTTPRAASRPSTGTLELLSEVPAEYAPGSFSKVVGLADVPGNRFAYALFDGGEIWVSDFSERAGRSHAALSRPACSPTTGW